MISVIVGLLLNAAISSLVAYETRQANALSRESNRMLQGRTELFNELKREHVETQRAVRMIERCACNEGK